MASNIFSINTCCVALFNCTNSNHQLVNNLKFDQRKFKKGNFSKRSYKTKANSRYCERVVWVLWIKPDLKRNYEENFCSFLSFNRIFTFCPLPVKVGQGALRSLLQNNGEFVSTTRLNFKIL